jgi:hypothetical protein
MIQNEVRAALVIFLMGTALACTPPQPETPAEFCAEAAAIYMGLQLPVSVESENSDAPGSVTVSYQGMDRANIPAKGEATCVFADSAAPGSGVESAVVNGEPLGQHEIEALNRKLASP